MTPTSRPDSGRGNAIGEAKRRGAAAAAGFEDGGVVLPPDMVAFLQGSGEQVNHLTFIGMQTDMGGLYILKTLASYQSARACGLDVSIGLGGLLLMLLRNRKQTGR